MAPSSDLDVVIYGATGYTGRLVAEFMAKQYGAGSDVRWAMAGRSRQKLEAVRDEIGAPAETPLIVADANDADALAAMVGSTKVVCTTVGPYQLYGEPVVAACAEAGTGYVDLCGEPAWMAEMIARYHDRARQTGSRIVFSCGFDSIPFDLGVFFLQQQAKEELGGTVSRVKGRVRAMQGRFSGGTAASLAATMKAAGKDPAVRAVLQDFFALTPGFEGPAQPDGMQPMEDPALGAWVAPFIMAPINTRNIHRSNFLMGHPYGRDFVYDEMMVVGPGERGEKAAKALARTSPLADDPPKPGEGPTREEREAGHYDVLFIGEAQDGPQKGRSIRVAVKGDLDPGYGSTSKMIAESAVCLAKGEGVTEGGVYTPAAAFGSALITRLREHAGLVFERED
jgi:short subunit dehydrogenase-like uncharacterized protein